MHSPRISVIIPAYNEEKRIGKALSSLERQPYRDFEVIVVDNASSDRTAEIARKRARVVHEPRRGVSRARNAGARRARGEILFFMDADAVAGRGTLAAIAGEFSDGRLAIATGPIMPIERVSGSVWFVFRFSFNLLVRLSIALRRPYFVGSSIAVRRSVFARIGGFDNGMNGCEDGDISRRAARFGEARYCRGIRVRMSARRVVKLGALGYLLYGAGDVLGYLVSGKPGLGYHPMT